ncbi:MAG: Trk system potassium transporter TrkA [Bacteroidales bacterium]|nr:Trk system potassium transporter TrkA [Bacteroidales bacterium]
MKIILAGAGAVGTHLAKMLSNENHDITVIDTDPERLKLVGSTMDVLTLEGSATSIGLLKEAKIKKADLFIAVTESESTNTSAAIIGKQLGAVKTIARIDNQEYLYPENKEMFISLGIDYLIYPEKIAAREIVGLLSQTSTTDAVDFSGGMLHLYAFRLEENAPIIDKSLSEVTDPENLLEYRAVAITRNGHTIIPRGHDRFRVGDLVYVISNKGGVKNLIRYTGKENYEVRNIMILGGSRIGIRAARDLGDQHYVKLVERDRQKSYMISNSLDNTLVINGDGSNVELLAQEGLSKMDAFVAVTGNSETNILSCLLAKKMGVKKTIAEVENIDYIPLAENIGIDTIINKKLITASRIFRFTMSTEVTSLKCLTGTEAEVMEFIAKPDSLITKSKLRDIEFPADAIVGGVIKKDKGIIAQGDTIIHEGDHVVVFALPSAVSVVGKFFS